VIKRSRKKKGVFKPAKTEKENRENTPQ